MLGSRVAFAVVQAASEVLRVVQVMMAAAVEKQEQEVEREVAGRAMGRRG